MLDVFMVINLAELMNSTHHRAYTQNGFSALERDQMIKARKLACQLREWIFQHYVFQNPTTGDQADTREVYWDFLARQCRALLALKAKATQVGIRGEEEFSSKALERSILDSFKGNTWFESAWKNVKTVEIDTFAYPFGHAVLPNPVRETSDDGKFLFILLEHADQ